MENQIYEVRNQYFRIEKHGRKVPLTLYEPLVKTERSKIAVLAMHYNDFYLVFPLMIELAKRGYTAAGSFAQRGAIKGRMYDVWAAVDFLKSLPGIEKVILLGHSNGGCLLSCYQYIAENGTERFRRPERVIPFPEFDALTPADGLMLMDANYGIMDVLSCDPAVRNWDNGYSRIPELDIYNPENGYVEGGCSNYTPEFARRFQKAQVDQYRYLFNYCLERAELIKAGRGRFTNDEPIIIPGGGGGSESNKFFNQDIRYLGRTRVERPLLHKGGIITNEIVHTVRTPKKAVSSTVYGRDGSRTVTVMGVLEGQYIFHDDFGYDECSMWGADWDFSTESTRANVKGISVPLLCEGNTASIEFPQAEMAFEEAKSEDKSIVFLEGAVHPFFPLNAEKYGDTVTTMADYCADWIAKPGRFTK